MGAKKLLFLRTLERVLSFLRLIGMVLSGAWAGYNILSIISSLNAQKPMLNVVCLFISGSLLIIMFFLKKPLERMNREINEQIDDFEDMIQYSHKKAKKNGQFDENGEMSVNILLKRGSLNPMEDLDALVGLSGVKEEIRRTQAVFEYENNNKKINKVNLCRHYAFLGNPGTGKTTVVRVFAGLLFRYGRIKKNMYLECTGNDLTGEFAGQTKSKVDAIYKKARGGVLFIDEAYSLCGNGNMANEAVSQLLVHMESDPYTVIIFAGYKDEMEKFLMINPGLDSRVSRKISFADYTSRELVLICKKFCMEKNIGITKDAADQLLDVFGTKTVLSSQTRRPFSNGRFARNCFDFIYQQHALNVSEGKAENADYITGKDVTDVASELLDLS